MGATDVHTCPRCALRFTTTAEMDDHLVVDHHVALRRAAYPLRMASHKAPASPAPAVGGVVVVPVDPAHDPSGIATVAATLTRQAAFGLDFVAVRDAWLSSAATEAHLAARGREAAAAGAPSVTWHDLGVGDRVAKILEHVDATEPALLCMTTRARSAVGEALLGSVSEAVLRRSPIPVVLVGPRAHSSVDAYRRVIVGVDGSALAAHAARVATELGALLSAEVFLFEVRGPGRASHEEGARVDVDRLLAGLPQQPAGYEVLDSRNPARALLDHAGQGEESLFVLGTHGRSTLRRLTMGSVALDVVRDAECPVVVVPDALSAGRTSRATRGGASEMMMRDRGHDLGDGERTMEPLAPLGGLIDR